MLKALNKYSEVRIIAKRKIYTRKRKMATPSNKFLQFKVKELAKSRAAALWQI